MASIENVIENKSYDLILTLTTNSTNCNINCEIMEFDLENTKPPSSYEYANQTFFVFNFSNMTQYKQYKLECLDLDDGSLERDTQGIVDFVFPKSSERVKVVAFGDIQNNQDGQKLVKYIEDNKNHYDAALLLGDSSYSSQKDNNFVKFTQLIQKFSKDLTLMVTPGNLDRENYLEDFLNFFNMPDKIHNKNLYYSFDIQDTHFVSVPSDYVSSEIKVEAVEKMLTWLDKDLKSTYKKWKIVYMHRPIYCTSLHCKNDNDEETKIKNLFEKLFNNNKVDLIISSHLHVYERLYPIFEGKVDKESVSEDKSIYTNPKYPVYIVCGGYQNGDEDKRKLYFNE
jgi:hypothetical protein